MSQYINFSYALPVKFYPSTSTPGGHFDDDWAVNRIKSFETTSRYHQRWQAGDETTLQIESTIPPEDLKIYNCKGVVVDSIAWTEVLSGIGIKVYHLTLNLDAALAASPTYRTFYLYQRTTLMSADFKAISEPIEVGTWPNTNVFEYTNSYNAFGLTYSAKGYTGPAFTAPVFRFRVESGITDYKPDADSSDYIDELHDVELLSATPYDTFKLNIGTAPGVAEWAIKLLNFIIHHDNWKFEIKNNDALQYVKAPGAKWDINRVKGYTLIGASIDILPATNRTSLQLSHSALTPGIITGYNLDTSFFGTGSVIKVTEITID